MTLIAVALADDTVIQVSDHRLTSPNGSVFTDQATKAVCGVGFDEIFSIAYTGVARWLGEFNNESIIALRRVNEELVGSLIRSMQLP